LGPATDPGRFYRIAFCAPGASAMDWYQRDYAPESSFDALLASAGSTPTGCDGLCAVSDNGTIRFLKSESTKHKSKMNELPDPHGTGHQVRAVMELTGRNTAKLLNDLGAMETASRILAVGGAARSDLWMQVVEQTSGVAVSPARPADTAARGAAMFATVATGLHGSLEECAIRWSKGGETEVRGQRAEGGNSLASELRERHE
jgi:xylulokinase